MKVIYEFDEGYDEKGDDNGDRDRRKIFDKAEDMQSVLWDIDMHCRGVVKYADDKASEDKIELAEHIRTMIYESDYPEPM